MTLVIHTPVATVVALNSSLFFPSSDNNSSSSSRRRPATAAAPPPPLDNQPLSRSTQLHQRQRDGPCPHRRRRSAARRSCCCSSSHRHRRSAAPVLVPPLSSPIMQLSSGFLATMQLSSSASSWSWARRRLFCC